MMRYFLTACALTLATPAFAIERCMPALEMANALRTEHQQVRRFVGIDSIGRMFEVYASKGGFYTVIVTTPDMQSCIAATGQAGNVLAAEALGVDG